MDTLAILAVIDSEISKLEQARAALVQIVGTGTVSVSASKPRKRPGLSRAARARIAAAQKKRWAAVRRAAKAAPVKPAKKVVAPAKRRTMSAAARKRIAAAQKKRWAAIKATKKAAS